MSSPTSCVRCARPVPADSVRGLCAHCLSADQTTGLPSVTPPSVGSQLDGLTETGDPAALRDDRETVSSPPADFRAGLPQPPPGYDLLKRLGGGGMGDVFLAREHATERAVAMKFLRSTSSPTAVDRFLAEVRALARIDHPHIVRVLSTDFLRTTPFYTMELATGGTLSGKVEANGPLPATEAARVIATAARAVHAAHAASVLHRDLKPSNILLSADGSPKVADFGLAKLTDVENGPTLGSGPIGTPGFMPPEQVSKRYGTVGPAADVYGLGATLYHVLTGRPPFTGETPADVISKVESSLPERPRTVRADIPANLEAVVVKCLEKDPTARYPDAAALADDLDRFLAGQTPLAPALTPWRRARRWASRNRARIAVAAALLLVVAVGIAVAVWPKADPQDTLRAELKAGRTVRILGETGHPDWLKDNWLVNPADRLTNSTAAGGACAFESLHPSLLAFMRDPGIDSYKVSGEFRIMRNSNIPDPTRPPSLEEFMRSGTGLFLGHVSGKGTDAAEVHGFMIAQFRDYLPEEIAHRVRNQAAIEPKASMIVIRATGVLQDPKWGKYPVTRFDPAPTLPGEWRLIQAEVRPSGVKMFWAADPKNPPQLIAEWTADQINAHYAELTMWLRTSQPFTDLVLPTWSPRSPFGIWSNASAVAVRNVTVEPLK